MASTLKRKAVKGISWNFMEKAGIRIIKFVLGVILARLLTPKDFGLIGMIGVFFAIAQTFVDSGFGMAYVQKKDANEKDANTIFYTNLTISIFLYAILWFTAPYIAKFYDQVELINITRVLGLVVIINSFNVIQVAFVKRNIDFKRKTKVTLIATLVAGATGILSALNGLGVWSLVIQQLTNRVLATIGLWVTSKWVPSLSFSKESFKSLFSYGSWLLASSIISKIFENIYILAIGKFFPAAQVGYFTKSRQFQKLATKEFLNTINSVAFPIFSKMQDNKDKLANSMQKFLSYTLFIILPVIVTLFLIAKSFIVLLLTEKWAPMIPYFQILLLIGFFMPYKVINFQILKALGRSDRSFKLSLIFNGLRLINIAINYQTGVLYIIIGEVVISFISIFVSSYHATKMIGYGILRQLLDTRNILMGAIIAGLLGYLTIMNLENLWLILIIGTFSSLGSYLLFQYLFNSKLLLEIINIRKLYK